MQSYIVTEKSAAFNVGQILKLTKEQYQAREHALKKIEGTNDQYEVTSRIEFKKGEKIGFAGEPNKVLLQAIVSEKGVTKSEVKNDDTAGSDSPNENKGSRKKSSNKASGPSKKDDAVSGKNGKAKKAVKAATKKVGSSKTADAASSGFPKK